MSDKPKPDFSKAIKWEQHDPLTVDIRQPDGTVTTHTVSSFLLETNPAFVDGVIVLPEWMVGMSAAEAKRALTPATDDSEGGDDGDA